MLQIRHLEKIIDGRSALAIDSLDIEAGEVAAAIGPSGCGKTLLIHVLAGALAPSRGSVVLDGQHILSGQKDMRSRIGVLFAEDLLYARQNVRSTLEFHCRLLGLPLSLGSEMLEIGRAH